MENKEEYSPYCDDCGSCGEEGCCSPLKCAHNNMVINAAGMWCDAHYDQIVFMYRLAEELFEKYQDQEVFDKVWDEVHAVGIENNE